MGIFMLCMCTWASRFIRVSPAFLEGQFLWFRTAEWPVLMEHFAAALGLPSLCVAIAYWAVANPDIKRWDKRAPVVALLLPIFLALFSVVLLAYGAAGHEMEQLLLAKPSNYGQYVAQHCLPAQGVHELAICTSDYRWIVYRQGMADAAGALAFMALLLISSMRAAAVHFSALGDSRSSDAGHK